MVRPSWLVVVVTSALACSAPERRAPALTAAPGLPAVPAVAPAVAPAPAPSFVPALDAAVRETWAKANVTPAPAASDGEYLRRVTLDLAGRVPTRAEVAAYHGDKAALVESLLASPDYAEHWADVYEDLLVGRAAKIRPEGRNGMHEFLVDAFARDVPYDAMVRRLLEAVGPLAERGEGGFVAAHLAGGGSLEALTGATARVFLGVQLQCAQCHDHPYDKRYKQEDFWGLAAFYARTRTRNMDLGDMGGKKSLVVFDVPRGQTKMKKHGTDTEVVVQPRFLGRAGGADGRVVRRAALADAVVGSDLFAKALVNRTWAELFGRGLVDPWDDLGGENDSDHPRTLVALADELRRSGYDVRALLRTLVLSEAYGRASSGGSDGAERVFARAAVRPLSAETLFRSLVVATGTEEIAARRLSTEELQKKLAQGLKQYIYVFGDDEMGEIDRGSGTVQQALLLWNGELTNRGSRAAPGGVLRGILDEVKAPARRLDAMFAVAYARRPTDDERARLQPRLKAADTYEDIFFALLASTEFTTTH
jgi:hypothetical protein